MQNVLTLILAGGKGTRLEPLTKDRAKPAVPFGGLYRIIDFTLSNCINSNLRKILVLTQYKGQSLDRHLIQGWSFLSRQLDEYVVSLPPQQRIDENWYRGTADAIYQNIYTIEKSNPKYILVLSGDHIYKMDYSDMIRHHINNNAEMTIGCIQVPTREATQFGVMEVDNADNIIRFIEKPSSPPEIPGNPGFSLASMGIYVFDAAKLFELLFEDAAASDSEHDFGKNIIPRIVSKLKVQAFRFQDKNNKATPYWRDVGTLDAYYQANMDLIAVDPFLNLYDSNWPIRTFQTQYPPPKFVFNDPGNRGQSRRGEAHDSMVCQGCIISGGNVTRSILSPGVRVNSYATVEDSILFEDVDVGRHARIRNAIIDKYVKIPPGMTIGYDLEEDRRRGFTVSENGIVVLSKAVSSESYAARQAQR